VPEYDQREAARYALLTWDQFWAKPRREQATIVAHYYLHSLVEAHTDDAIQEDMDRQRGKAR